MFLKVRAHSINDNYAMRFSELPHMLRQLLLLLWLLLWLLLKELLLLLWLPVLLHA